MALKSETGREKARGCKAGRKNKAEEDDEKRRCEMLQGNELSIKEGRSKSGYRWCELITC